MDHRFARSQARRRYSRDNDDRAGCVLWWLLPGSELRALALASRSRALGALPIIVDGSFQFPSEPFNQELRARADYLMEGTGRHVEDLISLIGTMFQEIGISVRCQDSQAILEVSMWMEMSAALLLCERWCVGLCCERTVGVVMKFWTVRSTTRGPQLPLSSPLSFSPLLSISPLVLFFFLLLPGSFNLHVPGFSTCQRHTNAVALAQVLPQKRTSI